MNRHQIFLLVRLDIPKNIWIWQEPNRIRSRIRTTWSVPIFYNWIIWYLRYPIRTDWMPMPSWNIGDFKGLFFKTGPNHITNCWSFRLFISGSGFGFSLNPNHSTPSTVGDVTIVDWINGETAWIGRKVFLFIWRLVSQIPSIPTDHSFILSLQLSSFLFYLYIK